MRTFMRIVSVTLITALLVGGLPANVPFFGLRQAAADPGTYIRVNPQQFAPARGESTEVSWDYDFGHPTLIEISRGGTLVYSFSGYFGGGDNYWTWGGCDSSGAIVPDGSYLVTVIPDDEYSPYAQSTVVSVYNPPPSTPTIGVSIDGAGNLVAGGTGDPGSGITVYTDNVRSGSTSVDGSGSWQVPLNVTPDTVHTVAAVASSGGKTSDLSTPERFLQHEIAPGEVLSQTADHYYMTGGDTSAIRNANSGVDIRPGTRILVPNPVVGGTPTASS